MASLLGWLEGAVAQVNPFDGGADFNSVQKRRKRQDQPKKPSPLKLAPPTRNGLTPRNIGVVNNSGPQQPLKVPARLPSMSSPMQQAKPSFLDYLNPIGKHGLFGTEQQKLYADTIKPITDKIQGFTDSVNSKDDKQGFQWSDPGDYQRFVQTLLPGMAQGVLEAPSRTAEGVSGQRLDGNGKVENINGVQRLGNLADATLSTAGLGVGGSGVLLRSLTPGLKTALGKSANQAAVKLAKSSGTEAIEEAVQTLAQDLADNGQLNATLKDYRDAAGLGALGGGMMHGAGAAVQLGKNNVTKTVKEDYKPLYDEARAAAEAAKRENIEKHPAVQELNAMIQEAGAQFRTEPNLLVRHDIQKRANGYIQARNETINQLQREAATNAIEKANLVARRLVPGGTLGGELASGFKDAQAKGRVFEGVDGKPRFEVDDSGAKLTKDTNVFQAMADGEMAELGYVLDHPKLYEQYPELSKTPVIFDTTLKDGVNAEWNGSVIKLNPKADLNYDEDIAKTILHEVQHNIQDIEGFASGGTNKGRGGNKKYQNLAGEAEARAVASRMNMSDGERYKMPDNAVYHGTGAEFDAFSDSFRGTATKSESAKRATFFTDSKDVAQGYADYAADDAVVNKMNERVRALEDKARRTRSQADWDAYDKAVIEQEKMATYDSIQNRLKNSKVKAVTVDGDFLEVDAQGKTPSELAGAKSMDSWLNAQLDKAQSQGKAGVKFVNLDDTANGVGKASTHYAVFDNKNIKLAKPQSTFYDSLDVPKEDLIIRDGGGKAMSVEPSGIRKLGDTEAPISKDVVIGDTKPLKKGNVRPDPITTLSGRKIQLDQYNPNAKNSNIAEKKWNDTLLEAAVEEAKYNNDSMNLAIFQDMKDRGYKQMSSSDMSGVHQYLFGDPNSIKLQYGGKTSKQSTEVTKKYEITTKNGTKKVAGEPVRVASGIDTFIHQDGNGNWVVSEVTTGASITGGGFPSKKHAIDYAKKVVQDAGGVEKVKEAITAFSKDGQKNTPQPKPAPAKQSSDRAQSAAQKATNASPQTVKQQRATRKAPPTKQTSSRQAAKQTNRNTSSQSAVNRNESQKSTKKQGSVTPRQQNSQSTQSRTGSADRLSYTDNMTKGEIKQYVDQMGKVQDAARKRTAESVGESADRVKGDFREKFIDDLAPIEDRLNKAIKSGAIVDPKDHITYQLDRTRRAEGIVHAYLKDSGLAKVIQEVPNTKEFDQYLIAKHAKELNPEVRTGRNAAKDAALVKALDSKYSGYAKEIYKINQNLLDKAVDYGLIDKQLAKSLKKQYPEYVPLNRVFNEDELGAISGTRGGEASISKQTAVQKIKGSNRAIDSPINSIIDKVRVVTEQGERNQAAKMLASYRSLPGNPFNLNKLPDGEAIGSRSAISYLDNGKKVTYLTDKTIADAAKGMTRQQIGLWGRILSAPTRVLRAGATTANAGFAGANVIKDIVGAAINSKNTISIGNPKVVGKALAAAFHHNGEYYSELMREGVAGTSFDMYRNMPDLNVKEVRSQKNVGRRALHNARPDRWFRSVENTIGRSEDFGRALQYYANKSGFERQGMPKDMAKLLAADEARHNSTNFFRHGSYGKNINLAIPYWNAGVQGARITTRRIKERPVATLTKLGFAIAAPSAAIALNNYQDEEKRKVIDNIPDYEKEGNIIIVGDNAKFNEETGRWENVHKWPVPPQWLGVHHAIQSAVKSAVTGEAYNPAEHIGNVAENLTTVNPTDVTKTANNYIPQLVKLIAEPMTNSNFFTRDKIVPDSMQNLDPENQKTKATSGVARVLGKLTGASPMQIDNTIRTGSGGAGQNVVWAIDKMLEVTGAIEKGEGRGRNPAESVTDRFVGARGTSDGVIYFKTLDEAAKKHKLSGKDLSIFNSLVDSKMNSRGEIQGKNERDALNKYQNLASHPNVSKAMADAAKERSRQTGEPIDPLYMLDHDKQMKFYNIKAQNRDSQDQRDLENREASWYKDFSDERRKYFDAIDIKPGKSERVKYPEPTPEVQKLMDTYFNEKNLDKKYAMLDDYPEITEQFEKLADYTNDVRKAQGVNPLRKYPQASERVNQLLDAGNFKDDEVKSYLQQLNMYNVTLEASLAQIQGNSMSSKGLKAAKNLGYSIVKNEDGTYSLQFADEAGGKDRSGVDRSNTTNSVSGSSSGSSRGGSGGGSRGNGITAGKALVSLISSTNKVKVPKTTGGSPSVNSNPKMKKTPLRRYAVADNRISSRPVRIVRKKARA